MSGQEIKGHLDALLLAVVAEGPVHGYAVLERLRARSDGHFDLPEGTIYPALHRLEAEGQLRSKWKVVAGRRRRLYELTDRGRAELGQRASDWRRFVDAVEQVLCAVGSPAGHGAA